MHSPLQKNRHVGIVGATGAVGLELLATLEKRHFPVATIRLFASANSLGRHLVFQGNKIAVETLQKGCFQGLDLVFFSAGSKIAKAYAPQAVSEGAIVIDNSSAFRSNPNVPLVIPEVNAHAIASHKGIIANPNCSTIIMLMALAPLHRLAKIKRIVAATYQAASGAGAKAMQELMDETRASLENRPYERSVIPFPYAFNLFLHNSPLSQEGYAEEEVKLLTETRKILEDPSIRVAATCVRVPVLRAHSEALNVEFHHPLEPDEACALLQKAEGISCLEDRSQNRFPMPLDVSGKDDVFYGRVRKDLSQDNTLDIWVVGDQLLKGAALNAVQIAEKLLPTEKISAES